MNVAFYNRVPVGQSMVSANYWLRSMEIYVFRWLTFLKLIYWHLILFDLFTARSADLFWDLFNTEISLTGYRLRSK